MKREEIKKSVFDIVEEVMCVGMDEINEEAHINNDLGADSLDAVEMIMKCESEFNLRIEDSEAEKIQTVGELITKVEEALNNKE
jgi:acyl carrier protein